MEPRSALVIIAAACVACSASGCYRAKPASGIIDLSDVPSLVAILIPEVIEGDFGVVPKNSSVDLTINVRNTGPYAASNLRESDQKKIQAPFSWKGGAFPGTGGDCGTGDVAPAARCSIVITYSPTNEGPHFTELEIEYIDGVIVAPMSLPLIGTTPAILALSPAGPVNFPVTNLGFTSTRELIISNTGGNPALLKSSSFTVPPASPPTPFSYIGGVLPGTGGTCSLVSPLQVGQTCKLELVFAPLAAQPFSSYTLNLVYDNGIVTDSNLAITLNGTGQ